MRKVLLYLFVTLLAVVMLLPAFMTIYYSLDVKASNILSSYIELFIMQLDLYPMFWNSVLYAGGITFVQLIIAILFAFGILNANVRGKKYIYLLYIMLMMMPLQVTILPNYIGLRDFGLLNTRWGILLPGFFSPFGVVIMYQFMKGIETSPIEAIRLETNSLIRVIYHTVLPQIKVCIFAVILFVFAEGWNMVEQPMLFLRDQNKQTLTIFIHALNQSGDNISLGVIYGASVLFMIPILLLYHGFNDYLEEGLTLKIDL